MLTEQLRTGETMVTWWLNAVHRIMPPRSASYANYPHESSEYAPFEHYSAMPPWFIEVDPNTPEALGECQLPELDDRDTLPLAFWDGLFYALIAEIKFLYSDLKESYGERFEMGNTILHNHITEGEGRRKIPMTVLDLAQLVEQCWDQITNPLLTSTLDYAVMQHASFVFDGEIPTYEKMSKFAGLYDMTSYCPEQITRWVAENNVRKIKVAVRSETKDIPGLLDACDAMQMRREEAHNAHRNSSSTLMPPKLQYNKPVRKQLPGSSSNANTFGASEIDESRYVNPGSTMASMTPPKTSLDTQSTPYLQENIQSFQKGKQSLNTSFSTNDETRSFPAYEEERNVPSLPADRQQHEETLRLLDGSRPAVLRRKAATSPVEQPERHAFVRSNTTPTRMPPYEMSDPLEPTPRLPSEQRYVSAGGNTPLHERGVMEDFDLSKDGMEEGFSIKKDELFAQLESKEQMEHYAKVHEARKSNSAKGKKSTGSSGWAKRVFSRKGSNPDGE
jgi:hypothetical protein